MRSLPIEDRVWFVRQLEAAFQQLGYWKNGRPDICRFAAEHGYPSNSVYRWFGGTVPDLPSLLRLSAHLKVTVDWLVRRDGGKNGPGAPALRQKRPRVPVLSGGSPTPQPRPAGMRRRQTPAYRTLALLLWAWFLRPWPAVCPLPA